MKNKPTNTKKTINFFFNFIDNIDRLLYGNRTKIFIVTCLFVLFIAPILDVLLNFNNHILTFYATFFLFSFLLLSFLAFIGSCRDDDENWSWEKARLTFYAYYESLGDTIETTKTNSTDENLFIFGQFLLFGGICWKALENVSVFMRVPLESFLGFQINSLKYFENTTNYYYWIPISIGFLIILFLYNKNPNILKRIKTEIKYLFNWNNQDKEIVKLDTTNDNLVVSTKIPAQMQSIKYMTKSSLLNNLITALEEWKPKNGQSEAQYQAKLYKHLRKKISNIKVDLEYPIGGEGINPKGRADVVLNDTILIEMKRAYNKDAIQRAQGQIAEYSQTWKNKGLVILLLCDCDYDKAKKEFHSTMSDLKTLGKSVITIVVNSK